MPKITAPTVAEHRSATRALLIDGAKALIAEAGMHAVTPRAVCERAGLARSSFYEYFPSKDDLLAAVALLAFEEWSAEVLAAVAVAGPGRAKLHAYVAETMRLTADGRHTLATELQQAEIAPKNFEAIMAMHDVLATPLRDLLREVGVTDPATAGVLVQGAITGGMQLVAHGVPADQVTASVTAMLDHGI